MIELAKTRKLSYGSTGAGTVMNIAGELINSGAHVQILHVPYRGVAPALPDLMAGRLDLLPADPPVLLPQVEARTVKPLVVFGTERLLRDLERLLIERFGFGIGTHILVESR